METKRRYYDRYLLNMPQLLEFAAHHRNRKEQSGHEDAVLKLDQHAKFHLFGSVPAGTSILSSDIDILVITDLLVEAVISEL